MKFKRPKMVDLADRVPGGHYLPVVFREFLEKRLGLHALNVAHEHIDDDWEAGSKENFFHLACRYLNLRYDLSGLDHIPQEGPCVIVSNHPHGMSDGLMFGDVVVQRRPDIKIVVNEFLQCVRGMRPYEITVDVYGGEAAKRANIAGMREMLLWLKKGHCLLVFPSGSAATYSLRDGRVVDDPWQQNIASLILKTGATVVPMHISGRTGFFFQVLSVISRSLRVNFLPREILRDGRMRHDIRLGSPISPAIMNGMGSDQLTAYMRLRSMLLRYNEPQSKTGEQHSDSPQRVMQPIAPQESEQALRKEIEALPPESLCYVSETSPLRIYTAVASQIPHMMREIGVQRERTFRCVGEGTGLASDLDEWDEYYTHLIMWDEEAGRIAGAYRIGLTDEILKKRGPQGIYNSHFFRMSDRFLQSISMGLELGRAFITPEYQRQAASLDTLWMGIGRFLNKNPRYKYLYGTVSISPNYSRASRALIHSYLKQRCMHPELSREISAYTPPQNLELLSEDARLLPSALPDIRVLSGMVSELEEGRGIPVLLKQYLRLGGCMVSFGIDEDFGGTLDCFVLVNLANTPERARRRYRGREYMDAALNDSLSTSSDS